MWMQPWCYDLGDSEDYTRSSKGLMIMNKYINELERLWVETVPCEFRPFEQGRGTLLRIWGFSEFYFSQG